MIKMFRISKDSPIKTQLETIWMSLYKDHMEEICFDLKLTENTIEPLREQLSLYLQEMSFMHGQIIGITGMSTNYFELENGDFVIAIDDNVYIG